MADNKQKWQDATRQILTSLNIEAEYRELDVRVSSKAPNANGWIECHSADVDKDDSPSAGINVADGPLLGRYRDFRSGRSCGLFDFAAKRYGDWKTARNHYAEKTKVKLPDGPEETLAEQFSVYKLTYMVWSAYCKAKIPVKKEGLFAIGALGALWPAKAGNAANELIAVPMYGPMLLELEPTAYHCVHANPARKVKIFRGKDNPERLEDVITKGDRGLMGKDGLERIADGRAKVINLTEGLSDLATMQTLILDWRASPPPNLPDGIDLDSHVVISAGSCTYGPKPEWMRHFTGTEVRIWFDVGDESDEGQTGAKVWVAALIAAGATVRNVQLDTPIVDGRKTKNDVRAWANTGKTYADYCAYAETFDIISPDDKDAQLSPGDALLQNLGLQVIGEHEATTRIEVFCTTTQKSTTISDVDRLSIPKLIQLVGGDTVEKYVHDGKEAQAGKVQMRDVQKAIASAASNKVFHADEKLGCGIWEIDGEIVLVKGMEAAILRKQQLEKTIVPFFKGRLLDLSRSTGDWYDIGKINRLLSEAQNDKFCQETFDEMYKLLKKWYWANEPAPQIVSSLIICSWLQTVWEWRPEIFITGGSDTGKSNLVDDFLTRGIFGNQYAMYVQKPTEAAIRQHMKHHARLAIVDEFEHDTHRQRILELFRTSSRGGDTIRGTADQRGSKYRLKHIPWFAAIETGLKKQADRNRYIILELGAIPPDKRGTLELPPSETLRDLGHRLLAIALRHWVEAKDLALRLKSVQVPNVPGRVVESFAVPCAMVACIQRMSMDEAREYMIMSMGGWEFGGQGGRDDVDLMQEILTSIVHLGGGRQSTVDQLLKLGTTIEESDQLALLRMGVRLVAKRSKDRDKRVLFIAPEVVTKQLLRGQGEFGQHSIGQYLLRLKGAKAESRRLGGRSKVKGVDVPMETIAELFKHDEEDESDYNDQF